MDLGFKGKVALVTGGNSGIGRATAVAFADEGAKVVIAARDVPNCEETISLIKSKGGDAIYVKTDMLKPEDIKAMIRKTIATYGRLDCAVNNAGVETRNDFVDGTEAEWDRLMNINLKGVWRCMMNEIPEMLKHRGGAIVNMSSMSGLKGYGKYSTYATAKHGLMGLTKSVSAEYAAAGIRINAICPGVIDTPMFQKGLAEYPEFQAMAAALGAVVPMGRLGRPEEVAAAAVWLCSDQASYISGISVSVDGGWSQH